MSDVLLMLAASLLATWVTFGFLTTDDENRWVRIYLKINRWEAVMVTAFCWIGTVITVLRAFRIIG